MRSEEPPYQIDRQQYQQEGDGEVVGHEEGDHHIAEAEEEQCEQRGVPSLQPHQSPQDAEEEYGSIEAARQDDGCCDIHGPVGARQGDDGLVQQVERVHQEGQQRVAQHVVLHAPLCQHTVGDGVEARHMEIVGERLGIVVADHGEETVVLADHHGVEHDEQQDDQESYE